MLFMFTTSAHKENVLMRRVVCECYTMYEQVPLGVYVLRHALPSFFKKVLLQFILPGHSHNTADRVVAWRKRKLKGEILYVSEQVVSKMNETTSVEAEFLDHCRSGHPFYCG
ncbi:Hypothetical protein PHPALM_16843 [Phytophthora palmivora]|uniref:Uncharacterized protein n=1 Tax=Phytophthora palmivora TaxID=4796 RepID=A0A2P4XNX6_9STRA|nr:Hypothetical protein PHPALM_16843 [Phytophthora palmivora]